MDSNLLSPGNNISKESSTKYIDSFVAILSSKSKETHLRAKLIHFSVQEI